MILLYVMVCGDKRLGSDLYDNVVSCMVDMCPNMVFEWYWICDRMNVMSWFCRPKYLLLMHETYLNVSILT